MTNLTDYMSFDVSWFTTLPGILITIGLILLIVGLICFLLSGKKNKKEETPAPVADANATAQAETPVAPDAPVVDASVPVATPEVVQQPAEVAVPTVDAVAPEPKPAPAAPVSTPEVAPVAPVEQPAPDAVELTPVPSEAAINGESTATDTPAQVEASQPEVTQPEVAPTENAVPIYGGASPQVTIEQDNTPKQVYGGADPLENTGAIPRVEVPTEPVASQPEEKPAEVAVPTVDAPANTEEKKVDDVETLEF